MSSPGYKQLLERALPLALIGAGDDEDALYLCQEIDALLRAPRERQQVRQAEAYAKNPEPVKARAKEYRSENPDYTQAKRRQTYLSRHAYRLTKGREYAAARKETGKAAGYREATREHTRAAGRARSRDVTDGYARELLAKNSPVSAKDFPQGLVEAKKMEIKLKRMIRDE